MRPPKIVLPTVVLALVLGGCKDEAASDGGSDPPEAPGDAEAKAEPVADDEAPKDEPAPEPPKEKAEGWGVLAAGTAIHTQPRGGQSVPLPDELLGGALVVARGEVSGGRVRIEAQVDDDEPRCVPTLSGLRDFSLRLFVDREAFVDVTRQEVAHEFDDGTAIKLGAGVPVDRVALGSATAITDGVKVRVPLKAEAVGKFFEPGQSLRGETEGWFSAEGEPFVYGDGNELDVAAFADFKGVAYMATETNGAKAFVTFGLPCLEAKTLTKTARLADASEARKSGLYAMKGPKDAIPKMARNFDPDMAGRHTGILGTLRAADPDEDVWGGLTGTETGEAFGVGGLGLVGTGRGSAGSRSSVAAGKKVMWADGTPAGTVAREHTFRTKPHEEGELRCWDVPVIVGSEPKLRLCFAPDDVESASGYGYGYAGSYGFGGRGKKVPRVRQAKAKVTGDLDKDIIRRIVRAHINEVRYCYNQGLVRDPALEGRVAIDFVINAKGKVLSSTVASETITDSKVSKCIAKAVKRWKFPRPRTGGTVSVTYPFVLSPG